MKIIKPLAVTMAVIMLMPMVMSCTSAKKSANVVKEDDPWYESNRFELKKDMPEHPSLGAVSVVCASNDRLFSLYCYSTDMWASARSVIDTYDYDGNLVNRKNITCNDDYYVSDIYSVSPDPEGKTIDAIVYVNSRSKPGCQAFASIDTETGTVSDIKEVFGGEAKKLKKAEYGVYSLSGIGDYTVALLQNDELFFSTMISDWKLALFKNTEFVTELDLSSLNIRYFEGFTLNLPEDSLYAIGLEKEDYIVMEFDINNGRLKSKNSFQDLSEREVNFAEYKATDNGEMCKIDSFGNVMKLDVNTMTSQTVIDTNWYTPYFSPEYSDGNYSGSSVMSYTEDRTVFLDYETKSYGCDEYVYTEYVRVLKKADKNPNAGKKIIELALPPNSGVTDYLARAIYEFNRTDNEYLIRVWDKYKTGFVVGRAFGNVDEDDQKVFKMIQDLKGDDAPDIAVGIQKNYAMRDEIFMDLSEFLDPEVMNKQYSNIIEAGRINGKLYFLPVTLEIEGLVTNSELLKDGAVGITFEEYGELVNEAMHGFSPYDYPGSQFYNKQDFLLSCIDTKSAIDGETVEFGTEQFRAAVKYTRENFEYDDENSIPDEYIYDLNRYRGECYYTKIDDYLDYVHACFRVKGRYSIIGTPSADASGPRFKAIETISVSATTDVEDGCKKFLNYLFSGAAFDSTECEFRQIVTNKEIMSKNIETLTVINNDTFARYRNSVESGAFIPAPGIDKLYGDKNATDDMRVSFLNSLTTISTYYYEDYTIVQFTLEELAPYYAGDRSLDDAIKYLNDRTTKYVREM